MKYSLDAVHPINRRVIKHNLSFDEVTDLMKELLDNGYDQKAMKLETFYEEGDRVEIPHGLLWDNDDGEFLLRHLQNFPIKGTIKKERFDRTINVLCIKWDEKHIKDESWGSMSIHVLQKLGFKFIPPENEEVSILECEEKYLSAEEIVLKYLMIDNDWTQTEAEEYLKPVEKAMNKAHAVFYQP